jgi:citrate lyase subunit beta/citryl-CoA lyase
MLTRAPSRGADALILDLEDSVAPGSKREARRLIASWLADRKRGDQPLVLARVNPGEELRDDVAAVALPGLVGIVLPKALPELVRRTDDLLTEAEAHAGLDPGSLALVPLVESASGLVGVAELARAPRVSHLGLGEADLAGELRIRPSDDARELLPIRTAVVVACALAGVGPPTGPTYPDFQDLEGLRRSTEALRRLGFRGRTAIHPAQVAIINEVFTPSQEEIEQARWLIGRFEEAEEGGEGVIVDDAGKMIDKAVLRTARETLEIAEVAEVAEVAER